MGISVLGLTKRYATTSALEGISFDVPDGKILSVLGPSGSGKTTLLRCIAGVEEPEAGRISIGAKVVFDASKGVNVPPEDRGIGMVFQSNALWPHMTVKKNVAYPLEVRGEKDVDGKVAEVLSLLKMDRLSSRFPSEISGGEQQRVAIARAIVYRPSLVLLDEPFSSLDVLLRESLRDDLRQLQLRLRMNMVYVTHDRVDALSLGDLVAIISDGKLLAQGPPESLLRSPPNSYTARFLGGMLALDGEASPDSAGARVKTEFGEFLIPTASSAGRAKLCIPPSACSLVRERAEGTIPGLVSGIARFPSGYAANRVTTDSGTVEVRVEQGSAPFSPGDQAYIVVDTAKCILLPS